MRTNSAQSMTPQRRSLSLSRFRTTLFISSIPFFGASVIRETSSWARTSVLLATSINDEGSISDGDPNRPVDGVNVLLLVLSDVEEWTALVSGASKRARSSFASASAWGEEAVVIATARDGLWSEKRRMQAGHASICLCFMRADLDPSHPLADRPSPLPASDIAANSHPFVNEKKQVKW